MSSIRNRVEDFAVALSEAIPEPVGVDDPARAFALVDTLERTLDAAILVTRPVYTRHATEYGVCACTTCTVARILEPVLADIEQDQAEARVTADAAGG